MVRVHPVLILTIWYVSHQNLQPQEAPQLTWFKNSLFHSLFFLPCYFPEGFLFLKPMKGESLYRHVLVLLTHLGGSTMISIDTLASSFLLIKPISSSAFLASTSTTGRGRESPLVSRSCVFRQKEKTERKRHVTFLAPFRQRYLMTEYNWSCVCRHAFRLTSMAALASSLTSKITAWAPLSSAMRAWRNQHRRNYSQQPNIQNARSTRVLM